jgi:putative ABC transport system substrate-binding protein
VISRRRFLGVVTAVVATARAAAAHPETNVSRIGGLDAGNSLAWLGFRDGLRDVDRETGRSITFEFRWSGRQPERYHELVTELTRINVDVLVTGDWQSSRAAKEATSTIPIVMLGVTDPPAAGFVGRFDRPERNVTGVVYTPAELTAKSIEILREFRPGVSRAALLYDPSIYVSSVGRQRLVIEAGRVGLEVLPLAVSSGEDVAAAFGALMLERPEILIVDAAGAAGADPSGVARFALQHRLPTISGSRAFGDAGFLLSYEPGLFLMGRHAANYIKRILNGARPAELPVAQHRKFQLVINLKTARALGLAIPPSLLSRADQVIE